MTKVSVGAALVVIGILLSGTTGYSDRSGEVPMVEQHEWVKTWRNPSGDGCTVQGFLKLKPGEAGRGIKVQVNPDCSLKTSQRVDVPAEDAQEPQATISADSIGIAATKSCTGHSIVEDPVAIDVTNLSNVINFSYDGIEVVVSSTKVYAEPFSTSGWYVSWGPSWHSHQNYWDTYELHSFANFENFAWGDDGLRTWTEQENRTFAYADGTCAIIFTTSLGGEDANLLSASGFIHYHSH